MKKKIAAVLAAAAITASAVMPVSVGMPNFSVINSQAADKATSGECGAEGSNLTWSIDDEGTLTVSGTGAMADYTNYASSAAPWTRSSIKKIVVEDGVESIGNYAFYYCQNLTSVSLPDSIRTIGDYAFNQAKTLADINIPYGVMSIGKYAFFDCKGLTELEIPETVGAIGAHAFTNTPWFTALKSSSSVTLINSVLVDASGVSGNYTVPEGVTYITGYSFANSTVTDIVFSEGVKELGEFALAGCSKLKTVSLPESLEVIGDKAFYSSDGITELNIPANVTTIGEDAFDIFNLAGINVADVNENYTSVGGVLYNSEKTELLKYPQKKDAVSYTVPDTVKKIAVGAFSGNTRLREISLPDGLEEICDNAFEHCHALRSIDIPDSVTVIGESAFEYCFALRSAVIGSGLETIPTYAFCGCSLLESVELGDSLVTIGEKAFMSCRSLNSVTIPDSLVTIEGSAFVGCESLKNVTFGSGLKTIGSSAFSGCCELESIDLPEGIETISREAFGDCKSLRSVVIPASVKKLEGGYGSSLNITTGENSYYYSGVFMGCTGLEEVTILAPLSTLEAAMFYDCTSLKKVTLPSNLRYINQYAFSQCISLEEIDLPDTVVYVYTGAFRGCSSLKEISFSNMISSIGDEAFSCCTSLERVIIPGGTYSLSIGNKAFYGCLSLEEAYIPARAKKIGTDAFAKYGNNAAYTYDFYALSEAYENVYDENSALVYIKTDNPDPESFSILTTASIFNRNCTFRDIDFLDSETDKNIRAVEGGYLWSFEVDHAGEYQFFIAENDENTGKVNIAKEFTIDVKDDYFTSREWMDEIIASQTDETMDGFEKMSALSKYLMSKFNYLAHEGDMRAYTFAANPNSPYYASYRWDSCTSPYMLSEFARRMGGFDEIVNLYSNSGYYGYSWNNGHYLCYCAIGDESKVFTACPYSDSGTIAAGTVDLSDGSNLYTFNYTETKPADYTPVVIYGDTGSAAETFSDENGFEFLPLSDASSKLSGYSITLGGEIGVNFFMDLTPYDAENADKAYMHFTLPDGSTKDVPASEPVTVNGKKLYKFSCGVAAKEMTKDITAQFVVGDKKTEEYTYSVKDYADTILGDSSFSADAKSLVKAMLNYGAYSQEYFGYNIGAPANKGCETVPDEVKISDSSVAGSTPDGLKYSGSSLLLKSNTVIRHYFKVNKGTDISEYTFRANGIELTPVEKDGLYYVDITDIPANALGTGFELTINGTAAVTFSAYDYIAKVIADPDSGDKLLNTVRTLYVYGESARAYVGG